MHPNAIYPICIEKRINIMLMVAKDTKYMIIALFPICFGKYGIIFLSEYKTFRLN